jgi:hypothetical protein
LLFLYFCFLLFDILDNLVVDFVLAVVAIIIWPVTIIYSWFVGFFTDVLDSCVSDLAIVFVLLALIYYPILLLAIAELQLQSHDPEQLVVSDILQQIYLVSILLYSIAALGLELVVGAISVLVSIYNRNNRLQGQPVGRQ